VTNALGKPLSLGLLSHQIPDRIPGNAILPNPVPAIGSASFSSPILPTSGRAYTGLKSLTNDQPENPHSKPEQGKNNLKLLSNPDTATLPLKISLNSDYMITEYLKRGADGAVYEGFKIQDGIVDDGKPLIFKFYHGGEKSHLLNHAQRSYGEIAILKKLSRLEDFDHDELVSVMPKIPGESLFEKISKLFEDGNSKDILRLIERYLELPGNFTDTWGLVHFDVRPQNVIVDTAGEMHLIDFAYTVPLSKNSTEAKQQRLLDGLLARINVGLDEEDKLYKAIDEIV
jgi:tRNA A-37 threonylcarbamoyl transferase component Bud32